MLKSILLLATWTQSGMGRTTAMLVHYETETGDDFFRQFKYNFTHNFTYHTHIHRQFHIQFTHNFTLNSNTTSHTNSQTIQIQIHRQLNSHTMYRQFAIFNVLHIKSFRDSYTKQAYTSRASISIICLCETSFQYLDFRCSNLDTLFRPRRPLLTNECQIHQQLNDFYKNTQKTSPISPKFGILFPLFLVFRS
jgi:hypothetical protein